MTAATNQAQLQQYAHVIPGMQAEAASAIADLVHGPADSGSDETVTGDVDHGQPDEER